MSEPQNSADRRAPTKGKMFIMLGMGIMLGIVVSVMYDAYLADDGEVQIYCPDAAYTGAANCAFIKVVQEVPATPALLEEYNRIIGR